MFRDGEITDAFRCYHELMNDVRVRSPRRNGSRSREYEATIANIEQAAWRLRKEYTLPEGWESKVYSWFGITTKAPWRTRTIREVGLNRKTSKQHSRLLDTQRSNEKRMFKKAAHIAGRLSLVPMDTP